MMDARFALNHASPSGVFCTCLALAIHLATSALRQLNSFSEAALIGHNEKRAFHAPIRGVTTA